MTDSMKFRYAYLLIALLAAIGANAAGCKGYGAVTSASPTPVPSISPAPDTLYVQDATTRTVRVYKNASALNGVAGTALTLSTSDTANPDVVYDPVHDVLWYPNQTTNEVWVFTNVSMANSMATPSPKLPLANQEGAEAYDPNHNYLFVAFNNSDNLQVFQNAAPGSGMAAFKQIALNFTDPAASGTPHPQEIYYDATHDRLFMADNQNVVAEFDNFGANVATVSSATSNRQITGLFSADGMAYNATTDTLFVGEGGNFSGSGKHQVDVIKNASTQNGPDSHGQTITNFATGPSGLAYDTPRDILYVYDAPNIRVIPNATAAAGSVGSVPSNRTISDAVTSLSGFGLFVDTTH